MHAGGKVVSGESWRGVSVKAWLLFSFPSFSDSSPPHPLFLDPYFLFLIPRFCIAGAASRGDGARGGREGAGGGVINEDEYFSRGTERSRQRARRGGGKFYKISET